MEKRISTEKEMEVSLVEINWYKGKDEFHLTYGIREEVFVKEQKVPVELEMDEYDEIAYHVVVFENNMPVATGRLLEGDKYFKVGRVAVLRDHRGKGYGNLVMESMIKKAAELGAREVHLHAQLHAKKFYENLGFESFGDIFHEAEIEHISMKRII